MVVRTRAVGARGESDTHDWRCLRACAAWIGAPAARELARYLADMALPRRTQVLLDGERNRAAAEQREQALGRFLAAPELPVGDWTQVKEELETLYERELGAPE